MKIVDSEVQIHVLILRKNHLIVSDANKKNEIETFKYTEMKVGHINRQ